MANQVWDDKAHLFLGEAGIYAHFYAFADWTKVDADLKNAFTFQIAIRVCGAQVWDTGIVPLQNGAITAKPDPSIPASANVPAIQGEIDDWAATNAQHVVTDTWSQASTVGFLVSSKADVTLPVSQLASLLGRVGGPIGAAAGILATFALASFGRKVRVTIGHNNVTIPVVRDQAGHVTQLGASHAPVAARR